MFLSEEMEERRTVKHYLKLAVEVRKLLFVCILLGTSGIVIKLEISPYGLIFILKLAYI